MAEYYPLLSKAVGSLPNSTPETRRVVYERARKALIGQLRTLHPPVPDEDIDRESVELDRAIARLEDELAAVPAPGPAAPPPPAAPTSPPLARAPPPRPLSPVKPNGGTLGPGAPKPFAPLRTKLPVPKPATTPAAPPPAAAPPPPEPTPPEPELVSPPVDLDKPTPSSTDGRPKLNVQRPIAPQPPGAKGPKRQMWIIWAGIVAVGLVVALVAGAAWKLRDRPDTIARTKPAEQQGADNGKISERVGDKGAPAESAPQAPPPAQTDSAPLPPTAPTPSAAPAQQPAPADQAATSAPAPTNPEVPVAQRAAFLVEAPNEANKVKTYLGNVVWKLNNVADGPSDAVGLAVEADVDLPDDKMKAIVTFEKNSDTSLPASHTIKVRFIVQPDSPSGNVKQINVPQLRKEDSPSGDPLAGVTVPVIENSFLVGLSPGNAETANLDLLRNLQWIDVPILLTSGRIAKLTFEKGAAGERDLNDAITAWQKQ